MSAGLLPREWRIHCMQTAHAHGFTCLAALLRLCKRVWSWWKPAIMLPGSCFSPMQRCGAAHTMECKAAHSPDRSPVVDPGNHQSMSVTPRAFIASGAGDILAETAGIEQVQRAGPLTLEVNASQRPESKQASCAFPSSRRFSAATLTSFGAAAGFEGRAPPHQTSDLTSEQQRRPAALPPSAYFAGHGMAGP